MNNRFNLPMEKLTEFCRNWKVSELAIFGSALREDFKPDSDIDVLVSFSPDARWTLFDWVSMLEELRLIFDREVDLVSRRGLETSRNKMRREAILSSAEVVYAA